MVATCCDLYCNVFVDSYGNDSLDALDGTSAGGCTGVLGNTWDDTFTGTLHGADDNTCCDGLVGG